MKFIGTGILMAILLLPRPLSGEVATMPSPAIVKTSLQVTDRDGHLLRSFLSAQETYQTYVPLTDISPWLIQAVLVVEDRRFYAHKGVDFRAVLRALWQNVKHWRVVSGASTITQQLIRLWQPRPKTWRGKLAEAWQAWQVEKHYSKEQILEQYLNLLEFGSQTQGVQAAARFYFGVPAGSLSLAQSALLAGIIQSPVRLHPLQNPAAALARRNRVLHTMLFRQLISQEQYERALAEPLGVSGAERPVSAPHFTRALSHLVSQEGHIQSTLDQNLQRDAEQAIRRQLEKLQDYHVTQAAVVVLENQTGEILAYVGSADFYDKEHAGQVDGVRARRQPGSALKPFVYALALQKGLTAATILQDEDTFFEGGFRPRNYDESFHGGVSLRRALANSYNVPVIKAIEPFGAGSVLAQLHAFGFDSLNRSAHFYGLGIALGGGEVTLLELANAYATLARGGVHKPVVWARKPYVQTAGPVGRVLAENISYILTDILADNQARADAFGLNSPLNFPFPAAAKTGTSKDYKDNFAIAYTPRVTVAVWAGNFDASSMQKVSGISGAAPILHDVLMAAQKRYSAGDFVRPDGVIMARICNQTGLLAGEHCTHTREELFTPDTVPTHVCDGVHTADKPSLQITFPVRGDVYVYDPALPASGQQLHLQVIGASQESCHWTLNGQPLAATETDFWWPLQPGKFNLSVACGAQTADTFFSVL